MGNFDIYDEYVKWLNKIQNEGKSNASIAHFIFGMSSIFKIFCIFLKKELALKYIQRQNSRAILSRFC